MGATTLYEDGRGVVQVSKLYLLELYSEIISLFLSLSLYIYIHTLLCKKMRATEAWREAKKVESLGNCDTRAARCVSVSH